MSKLFLGPVYFFIFVTGAAGLIYEVTWQKYLSRILGSENIATAVILAAFLGGLSGGYYLCGKLTTRVRNHFKAYALLEGIIAVWGIFFPMIFEIVNSATQGWSFSPPVLIILQGLFCSVLLMGVPTVCMGGTIPFLTRGISQSVEEATSVHAKVYGINTAGAFLGTLTAGFFLIPSLGLPLTVMETAILNLSAALFFFFASTKVRSKEAEMPKAPSGGEQALSVETPPSFRYPPWVLYTVAFLSGFYVMTLENVLIRLVNLSLGSSSYSFTMIVSVFVFSIAIGSYIVGRLKRLPHHLLFFNQLLIALLLMFLYFSLDTWPYWAHLIRISIQPNMAGFWVYYGNIFIVLAFALILPVSLMGATVPITFHEIKRDLANVGRHSGLLFSWNTIGNLIGSLMGGIVLFSVFDLPGIFSLSLSLAAVSACLAAWRRSRKYFLIAAVVTAAASIFVLTSPFYDVTHFTEGTFRIQSPQSYSMDGPHEFFRRHTKGKILRFYKDGSTSSVAVVEHQGLPDHWRLRGQNPLTIFVNGKSDSSTVGDISTLKLSAHLPAILASQRKNLMVIGLGTGVTAGELTLYPDVERIDIAEISPTVVEALPHFSKMNYDVHKNQKVRIHIGDAFRILGRSKRKWDIVISEPSNPWVSGVDLLFTKEFYALVKERLSLNGILLQWVQIYDADIQMVGMIVNTVMQVFQRCHVFMSNSADLLIVATDKEFRRDDLQRAENLFQTNEAVRESMEIIHLSSLDALLLRELWSPSYVRYFFSGSGIQTMDHPRLHYMAGKMFFTGAMMPRAALLGPHSTSYLWDYLMVQRYPEWTNFTSEFKPNESLLKSGIEIPNGFELPMSSAIKLRAYLYDSRKFSLTGPEKQFFMVDLIPMITGESKHRDAWGKVGLKEASYRRKTEAMLSHIDRHRNWIVPYRIDGLRTLLEEGIVKGADVYERNWCTLRLALTLTFERTDMGRINTVLANLIKDKDGRVLLRKGDERIWEMIEGELQRLSAQK